MTENLNEIHSTAFCFLRQATSLGHFFPLWEQKAESISQSMRLLETTLKFVMKENFPSCLNCRFLSTKHGWITSSSANPTGCLSSHPTPVPSSPEHNSTGWVQSAVACAADIAFQSRSWIYCFTVPALGKFCCGHFKGFICYWGGGRMFFKQS